LLKAEFEKYDISVIEDSPKELKLSIITAKMIDSRRRCVLHLEVETGSGYKKKYKGESFGVTESRAIGGAITEVVITMLNDNKIVEYITDKERVVDKKNSIKKLEQLKDMLQKGLINEEDYERTKSKILDEF